MDVSKTYLTVIILQHIQTSNHYVETNTLHVNYTSVKKKKDQYSYLNCINVIVIEIKWYY